MSEVADDGAALTRQLSGHGPEYDALLAKGIPRQRLRRAWIACAGDAEEAEQYVRDNADQPSEFWDDPLAFPPPCQPEPENEKGDHEHASKCEVAREQLRRALALLEEPSSTASLADGAELAGMRAAVLQALGDSPAREQCAFRASDNSSALGLLAASALPTAEGCAESDKQRCRRLSEALEAAWRPADDPDAAIQLVAEDRVDFNLGCVRRQLVTRALASREARREVTELQPFSELRKFSEEARPDCWVGATVVDDQRRRDRDRDRDRSRDSATVVVAVDDEHADELAKAVAEVRRTVDELVAEPRARQAVQRALRAQTHPPGSLPITVPAGSAFSEPTVICEYGEKSGAAVEPEIPAIGHEIEIQLLCRPAVAIQSAACDEDADAVREAQRWCSSGAADKPRWVRGTVVAHSPWLAGSTLLAVEPLVDVADDTEPIIAPLSDDELSSIAGRLASEIAPGRIKKLPTVNDEGKEVTKSRHYARRHFCGSKLGEHGQCSPDHGNQCASCARYDAARDRVCPRHWWLRYSTHLHRDSDDSDDSGDEEDDSLPELDWSWKAVVSTAPQPFEAGVLTHVHPASRLLAKNVQNESGSPGRTPARAWIRATEPAVVLSRKLAVSKRLCREHPELLVGQQLQLWAPTLQLARSGFSYDMSDADVLSQYDRPTTRAVVRGYVRETGMHVVQVAEKDFNGGGRGRSSRDRSDDDDRDAECSAEQMRAYRERRDLLLQQQVEESQLQLINLKQVPCVLRPGTSALPVAEPTVLADAGTHTHQCQVCWSSLLQDDFVDFCFRQYRVDGHETDITSPRHPHTVCHSCLRQHVASSLEGGRLSVRCPVEGCGRALQTGELRSHTSTAAYTCLMERIRAAEEALDSEARAAQAVALSATGLELRSCPRCGILIEKNQGCDHMRCYRCDHGFSWSAAAFAGQGTRAANSNTEQTLRRYALPSFAALRLPQVQAKLALVLVSGFLAWHWGGMIQIAISFAIWQLLRLGVWVCCSPGVLLSFLCSSVWTGSFQSALPCFYLAFSSFWMYLMAIEYTKVVTLLGVAANQHDSLLRRVLYVIRREDQSSYYRSEAVRDSLLGLAFMIFTHINVCWFFAQIANDTRATAAAADSFWNFSHDSSPVAEGHAMCIRQDNGREGSVIEDGSASCVCNDVESCFPLDAEAITETWWSFPAVAYWIPPLLPVCVLWHHLAEWLFVRVMCWRVYYLLRGARVGSDRRPVAQVISATFEDANYCNSWMVKLCYAARLLGYAYGCAADAGWLNSDDRLRPTVTTYGTSMALVLASGSTLLTFAPIVWHRIK